jgi:ribosome-associated protein
MTDEFKENLRREIRFRTARSGGAGGQNVNKVETKVEILFDIQQTKLFDEADKALIMNKLESHINSEGILLVMNQTERTQLGNKGLAEKKLFRWLTKALEVQKPRKASPVPKFVIAQRAHDKKHDAEKKAQRRKVRTDTPHSGSDLSTFD